MKNKILYIIVIVLSLAMIENYRWRSRYSFCNFGSVVVEKSTYRIDKNNEKSALLRVGNGGRIEFLSPYIEYSGGGEWKSCESWLEKKIRDVTQEELERLSCVQVSTNRP